jgi:hypothetical protein
MNQYTKAKLKAAMDDAIERSLPPSATVHLMADQAGVDESTVRAYLNRTRGPSPSNPAKKARALAMQEARKRNLWGIGQAEVFKKWWRPILAKIFPKLRKKYADWIGRFFKATVKRWAKQVRASVHDQALQSFLRAQARNKRKEERKKREEAMRKRNVEHDFQKNIAAIEKKIVV